MADARLLTNHGEVLLCVARRPGVRIAEIARCVDVTERAAHRILCELESDGYLTRHRVGRRNIYEIHSEARLRQTATSGTTVGQLLRALGPRQHDEAA